MCSTEDGIIELFWNKEINLGVAENRPDVVVLSKVLKKWTLIDFSVPWSGNVKAIIEDEKNNEVCSIRSQDPGKCLGVVM